MTGITQHIPNYIQGISDQPDELKKPGQVRDLVNASPDVTIGLQKRAGLKYVDSLVGGPPDGFWTEIIRESVEGKPQKFICHIAKDASMGIWDANTGSPCPIYFNPSPASVEDLPFNIQTDNLDPYTGQATYLRHAGLTNQYLKSLTVNDFTFVVNPQTNVSMTASKSNDKFECFVELTTLAYNRSYDLDINLLDDDGTSSFRVATEVELIDVDELDYNGSCNSVNTYFPTLDAGDRDGRNGVDDDRANGLRLEIRTIGQSVQEGNGNSQSDWACRYTNTISLLNGGSYWKKGDRVQFEGPTNDGYTPRYTIRIKDDQKTTASAEILIRGVNTPSDASSAISASVLLQQLSAEIESNGLDCQVLGNGIYITHDEPFVITTPESGLFNILSQDDTEDKLIVVNNVSQLPVQCRKGLVVKIANSFSDDDDYFVEFKSSDGVSDSADGHWEEVAKPGQDNVFNPQSMPLAIVKAIDEDAANRRVDSFVVTAVDWNPRTCGTDDFNPSFAGRRINNILFFRSRLTFLSNENVIMSRPNDLFNFFPVTALTVSPKDPIDLSASSKQSSVLYDGIVINNGLVLFGEYTQFLFTTDSDSLRSDTAKCTEIAAYDYLKSSRPFPLGTNLGFVGTSNSSTRFYEMTSVFREGQPDVYDRAKIVERSISPELDLIADAKESGFLVFGKYGSKTLWCYRYFKEGSQRDLQTAWFKWELTHPLVYHFMDENSYYAVLQESNNQSFLVSSDILTNEIKEDYIGSTYQDYNYLDCWQVINKGQIVQERNSVVLPVDFPLIPEKTIFLVTDKGDYIPEANRNGVRITFNVRLDPSVNIIKVGYVFDYKVSFPTIYRTTTKTDGIKSDTTASLTIHRAHLNLGAIGYYSFHLGRFGKQDYVMKFETTELDAYEGNSNPVLAEKTVTLPIYDRNKNIRNLILTSSHPTPAYINSMTWEGDYSAKNYRRV